MSPSWPGASRLAWRASRGVVCTNSGGLRPDRIQRPAVRTRSGGSGMTTTTGPAGGTALGGEASVAPPPIFCPVEPESATTPDSGEHCELPVDAGYGARLPALIATLSSPEREIVLLRVVAGESILDIVD